VSFCVVTWLLINSFSSHGVELDHLSFGERLVKINRRKLTSGRCSSQGIQCKVFLFKQQTGHSLKYLCPVFLPKDESTLHYQWLCLVGVGIGLYVLCMSVAPHSDIESLEALFISHVPEQKLAHNVTM